jgi:hypothetical protein
VHGSCAETAGNWPVFAGFGLKTGVRRPNEIDNFADN